jgi:hypothetical protein
MAGQELFIPQIVAHLHCISGSAVIDSLKHDIVVSKRMPGPGAASDDSEPSGDSETFWSVPIIRHKQSTDVSVEVQVQGEK